ncbi:MAG: hypothetical protein KJ685_01070 [Nanoarchaeota archaeon]|nr:hypothetical protein [Nanoarchaeota archaeon]
MKLYYATTNPGKVLSMKRDLGKFSVEVEQVKIDLPESRSSDVRIIAEEKINYAFKEIKKPVIALDAGFYIHSLNGFPRAFVNFALETIDLEGILKLVEYKDSKCEFRECVGYMDNKRDSPMFFISKVPGIIADKPRGEIQKHLWSRLGLIFIPDGSNKTLGEMTYDEYLDWRKEYRDKHSTAMQLGKWLIKPR